MKRVLFITNYPSPYRVGFYDTLGRDLDVTVLYADRIEKKTHRDAKWFIASQGNCHSVQLHRRMLSCKGRDLCVDVISWLKKPWDKIVVCGYSSPTVMLAMAWLRLHRVPFYMEIDGGLVREDSKAKFLFKKYLVTRATWWLSSGEPSNRYLTHYGADPKHIYTYPFTSLYARDIPEAVPTRAEKKALRQKLGLSQGKVLLSVGRMDQGKGFDVLLKALAQMEEKVELCIVGGEPPEDYLALAKQLGVEVTFVDFRPKEELKEYYRAADAFVLPTRSDVWGLVINEAMACGLPVVTTNRCVAGLTLVQNGINGYLAPIDDEKTLAEKLDAVFAGDFREMGRAALETIRPYTIENMAKAHVEIFEP